MKLSIYMSTFALALGLGSLVNAAPLEEHVGVYELQQNSPRANVRCHNRVAVELNLGVFVWDNITNDGSWDYPLEISHINQEPYDLIEIGYPDGVPFVRNRVKVTYQNDLLVQHTFEAPGRAKESRFYGFRFDNDSVEIVQKFEPEDEFMVSCAYNKIR